MIKNKKKTILALTAPVMAAALSVPAFAQEAAAPEYISIFNTLLFLVGGFLVMWMAAGFAMLEMGLVRQKNVSMQGLKNIALYSVAGIMFWVTGYNLMYTGVDGGFLGSFGPYDFPAPGADDGSAGYSVASDWFFQMVFCATTASIVSGTLAERIKFWPFLIFTAVLTGILYPITGSWQWGAGWLAEIGFSDFAGSTLVHSVGGWAALAGALLLGARAGRYGENGMVTPMPGSSIPLATLGMFILWLGWFGFNGGSVLATSDVENSNSVAVVFMNTNAAAAGGLIAALIVARMMFGKADLTMALNGALAGLVAITAEPSTPTALQATLFGAIGGVLVVFSIIALDKMKIDDPVGAISVHGVVGLLGLLLVPVTNDGSSFSGQIIGAITIFVWVFVTSLIVWGILKAVMGIRVSEQEEYEGVDMAECGMEAYPEFVGAAGSG
ncbi:ammonium transporter [uncultured Maritalea sp.]|uniref:ammonium transporter n=1 Tax=uncultured Maritalea sp. TaxID=757249 RepID=UPI0026090ABE|nr:ammonium transporter [uncultured Maritalea sp.]